MPFPTNSGASKSGTVGPAKGEPGYVNPFKRKKVDTSYIEPPPMFDNDLDNQVTGSLGSLTVGGNTLGFEFDQNFTVTIAKTGTMVVGTGDTDRVAIFSDENTIGSANLNVTGANVLTLTASGVSTLTVPYTGTAQTGKATALTPSAAISMDCATSSTFTLTPDQACAITPSNATAGTIYTLVITTSGVSSFNVTLSSPFKSTGVLATGTSSGKVFCLSFIYDGANLAEIARTTAM